MTVTLTLPGIEVPTWDVCRRADPRGRALADRHYSRRSIGAVCFTPPGRSLVLVTPDGQAVWASSYTDYPDDGLDAWRCTLFRREGGTLASALILAAMALTADRWGAAPPDGWVTWVRTDKVRSTNPGYCFLRAGWWRDRTYVPNRRRPDTIRLRAAA